MKRIKFNAEAEVDVVLRSQRQLKAIQAALRPEAVQPTGEKAQARVTVGRRVLKIRFRARDSSSLRAIMSSYMRMLRATVSVCEALSYLDGEVKRARMA
jgi:tRNA threonylcarbamoyladenosine modification (KEOPS) complex  Pcc1 subunit